MKKLGIYLLIGMGAAGIFFGTLGIIMVLVARDQEQSPEVGHRFSHYVGLILIIAIPAIITWGLFKLMRKNLFRNIHKIRGAENDNSSIG